MYIAHESGKVWSNFPVEEEQDQISTSSILVSKWKREGRWEEQLDTFKYPVFPPGGLDGLELYMIYIFLTSGTHLKCLAYILYCKNFLNAQFIKWIKSISNAEKEDHEIPLLIRLGRLGWGFAM